MAWKEKFRNFYIPRNKQEDGFLSKLFNFIICGQYLVIGFMVGCTLYESIRAIVIALVAESTSTGLIRFLTIKTGYCLSYLGVICLLVFACKFTIMGVYHFRKQTSLTSTRRRWLMLSGLSNMLIGIVSLLVSSEILVTAKRLTLDAGTMNSNQTWMLVAILIVGYIYVLGLVQDHRNNLKEAKIW